MSGIKQNGETVEINLFPKQHEFISSDCDDVLYGGAVGGGKAIQTSQAVPVSLNTSSNGFKKMGEIVVGDFVLSPRGEPVRVVWVSPIQTFDEVYEVEFDTGEKIVADARHLWKTMTAKERTAALRATPEWRARRRAKRPSRALLNPVKPGTQSALILANRARAYEYKPPPTGTIRTTREIFETQRDRVTNNHSIDVTAPIEFPHIDFLVEPYLLGVWLGDGSTTHGSFCKPVGDMREILSFVDDRDCRTRISSAGRNLPITVATPEDLTSDLRDIGVLGRKHIPVEYKRASVAQRMALLQGLCDTDGYCAEDGGIEIGFTVKQLIDDTFELATSLGIKAQVHEKRAMLNGKDYGPYWRMVFMASFPCFRLKRKLDRQKMTGLRDTVRRRYIVSVKRVDPVPMRCIQVDHEDGMYLVGPSFIPTHNSYAVMIGALKRRLENPGSQGIIFRRTFPELENSIIRETRKVYPLFGGVYNQTKHMWTFPNGSTQLFGFCEKDGDVYKHHGAEYADEWFDEATTFTQFQFNYLTSRARSANPDVKTLIRLTANPGGVGHSWVYDRYIAPAQRTKKWFNEKEKKWMSFIPAKLADNPALALADPGYLDRLKVLSEKKYLALAEGRWDVFEGTYFENFDPRPGHGVLWNIRKPDTYTIKFLSMDWGFSDPACILWYEVTPMGRIYVYRELYVNRLSPKELAQAILDLCPKDENYEYMVCSPEIFGKRVEYDGGGIPIADLIQEVTKDRLILKSANNARVPGWLKVREYLFKAPGDQLPWMQISPNCTNLIRTLPALVHSDKPNKVEDIDENGEDHCVVGDTTVVTRNGTFPIKDLVGTSGEILSSNGWQKYSDVRCTRKNAPVFRMTLCSGKTFTATADHLVMVADGWKQLGKIKVGEELPSWRRKLFLERSKSLMASAITFVENIFERAINLFIGSSGNFTTVQSPVATTSITSTTIDLTIRSQIWRAKQPSIISRIMLPRRKQKLEVENGSIKFVHSQPLGTSPMRPSLFMRDWGVLPRSCGGKIRWSGKFVQNVGRIIRPSRWWRTVQGFAISIARCVPFVRKILNDSVLMIESAPPQDVYNLEVENTHCYVANDACFSHNCAESLRYGLVSLSELPKHIITPYDGAYDRIFGIQRNNNSGDQAPLPNNRGGY